MNHRQISLKFLTNTGLIPVKVRPNQKDPFPDWDPQRAEHADKALLIKLLEKDTSLNLGALFTGKYIDVDVDTTNPYVHAALDFFLPATQYIWGRKSKRKGHRVYVLHEDFDRAKWSRLTRYLKGLTEEVINEGNYSVEVRGGLAKNGMFAVLPGSVHSEELIEWQEGVDPTMGGAHIEDHRLMRCIRLAIMSAIIASIWAEGSRNDVSLAFAGLLWRIRTSTLNALDLDEGEEPPDGSFLLSMEDCVAMFKCIMAISGDDPNDERSRLINLSNSWRKLDADPNSKVSGGKMLAELAGDHGVKIVKSAYRLLSDDDAAEEIERITEQFVMWYGMGVVIDLDSVTGGAIVPWMTYQQASYSLAGRKVTIAGKRIPVAELMFKSGIVQRVRGLTFDPSQDELIVTTPDGPMVNQWRGFACKPSEQKIKGEEVKPFLDYVQKIVCDGNEDAFIWTMAWMADMLQKPANRPGTSLVLIGVQGAGKTFLGEKVLGPMIGPDHWVQLNSINRLTKDFNTSIDNKIFVQCDESVHSYQKEQANRLKSLITDANLHIEPKGVNAYSKPNHMHFMFTSNNETAAMFIDPSPYERRYTVLRVSSEKATDTEYWKHMHQWIETNRAKVMRYLLDWTYTPETVRRPLATSAKQDMQKIGLDPEVAWIISRVQSGFILDQRSHENWFDAFNSNHISDVEKKRNTLAREHWPDRVSATALEQDFRQFARAHGRPVYSGSVMTTLRKIMPEGGLAPAQQITVSTFDGRTGQEIKQRLRLYGLPSREDIIDHLIMVYGHVIDRSVLIDPSESEPSVSSVERGEF